MFPAFILAFELFAPGLGKAVILGLAVVLGHAPFGFDPSLALQSVERRVKGAFANAQDLFRHSMNPLANAEPVGGLPLEHF